MQAALASENSSTGDMHNYLKVYPRMTTYLRLLNDAKLTRVALALFLGAVGAIPLCFLPRHSRCLTKFSISTGHLVLSF